MGTTDGHQGGQQASTYAELSEHATISGVDGKKVFVVGSDGNQVNLATETTAAAILATLGATNASPEAYTTADWLLQIKASIDSQLAILNFISDGTPTSLGQGTMAESQKVVIASDQTGVSTKDDPMALKVTESGAVTYVAVAPPGTTEATAGWQVKKIDGTTGTVITWCDGDALFDNVATDLTALTYS